MNVDAILGPTTDEVAGLPTGRLAAWLADPARAGSLGAPGLARVVAARHADLPDELLGWLVSQLWAVFSPAARRVLPDADMLDLFRRVGFTCYGRVVEPPSAPATLYRGARPGRVVGASWTPDLATAVTRVVLTERLDVRRWREAVAGLLWTVDAPPEAVLAVVGEPRQPETVLDATRLPRLAVRALSAAEVDELLPPMVVLDERLVVPAAHADSLRADLTGADERPAALVAPVAGVSRLVADPARAYEPGELDGLLAERRRREEEDRQRRRRAEAARRAAWDASRIGRLVNAYEAAVAHGADPAGLGKPYGLELWAALGD